MNQNDKSLMGNKSIIPSRRAIGLGLFSSAFFCGCASQDKNKSSAIYSTRPKVIVPIMASPARDEMLDAYRSFLGVPLARFVDVTLPAPDGFAINVRVAYPAVVTTRLQLIILCTDFGTDGINYDIIAGGIASRGYAVLTISSAGGTLERNEAAIIRRNTRRAQQASYVLDNLPKVLGALGRDGQMVETNKIGAIGHGEGAWTALGLVGWGRGLIVSSSIADARVTASFALSPNIITSSPNHQTRSLSRVIYGRTMIACDNDNMPALPNGSGIIGISLPPVAEGFGGIIGARTSGQNFNLRRRRPNVPQREVLASACAAAALFFDWSLRGDKAKLDILMANNGRVFENTSPPFSIRRA